MANISTIRLSGVTYNIIDSTAIHSLAGYSTTAEMNQAITAATDALATTIGEAGYQTATDVQNAITGKVDTSVYTAFTAATNASLADKLEASDVANFYDGVAYDSETQRINFKHGDTVKSFIDASPFLVDGMVDSVELTADTNSVNVLRITWNSAASKNVTDIPLSSIFNANNYYSKSDVDSLLAAKADTATTYTKTAVDNLLNNKQDTLVSSTNIKTINNQSILGSGNITINEGGTIDAEISSTSTNAVQNKVVKAALDTKNGVVTIDGETLVIS